MELPESKSTRIVLLVVCVICIVLYSIDSLSLFYHAPDIMGRRSLKRFNIAVIGSSGYIGARLMTNLSQNRPWTISAYDRIFPGKASYQIPTSELQRFDTVIYLGGLTGRKMCLQRPGDIQKENIDDIVQLAKRMLSTQLLIFASTSAIAEGSGFNPTTEDFAVRLDLLDLYSASMYRRENALRALSLASKKVPKMIGLRFGTVIGLSPSQRIDLAHMALVCQAFLGARLHITHPESYRGFLSMEDLVRAITVLIRQSYKMARFTIFNLQSFNASIVHVANSIAHRTGAYVHPTDHPPSSDSIGFSLDATKFSRTFNFIFLENQTQTITRLLEDVPRMCLGRQSRLDTNSTSCLVCGSPIMHTVLDLHTQPLANDFRNTSTDALQCQRFPLRLIRCPRCHHTQLSHIVDRGYLFSHYLYQSGTSRSLNEYFDWLAQKTINESNTTNGTVLELACNDGTQLNQFSRRGWKTVGVDPAKNLAEIARTKGHTVFTGFWGRDDFPLLPARDTLDIIIAQNVFAHVDNPVRFLNACVSAMSHKTKLYIQTSQCEMYETGQFDTVYHEHVSFFTAHSFKKIADLVGLKIINFEITPIHGRSCLVTFQRLGSLTSEDTSTFASALEKERQLGVTDAWFYVKYESQAQAMRRWIVRQLANLHSQGHTIVAYGAAAKGMVLLHFLLETSGRTWNISYVVDDAPLKQNTFCPGTSIPVMPTSMLSQHPPEKSLTIIVFAWNFWDEISGRIRKETVDIGMKNVYVILPFPTQQLIKLDSTRNHTVSTNGYRLLPWPLAIRPRQRQVVMVAHFYNEEFLLPYWIRHHASMFDAAILIDYNSTDRSVEIIRREAPETWRIVASRNPNFSAQQVDLEVIDYEKLFPDAWKISINIPEFLVHSSLRETMNDFNNGSQAYRFRSIIITGNDTNRLGRFAPLIVQRSQYYCNRSDGSEVNGITGYSRYVHRLSEASYSFGRHDISGAVWNWMSFGFISKFQYSPWPEIIPRKLQIRTRVPSSDFESSFGTQHNIDLKALVKVRNETLQLPQCDIRDYIGLSDELMMIHHLWKTILEY